MPQFPAESEWQAPWEKNGTEFNADVARHLIYNLQKSESTLESDLTAVRKELRQAKQEVDSTASASETLKEEALFGRKAKVAAENNIPLARAKWLGGDTLDEIRASAKEFLTDFGIGEPQGNPDPKAGESPADGQGEEPNADGTGDGGDQGGDEDPLAGYMLRRAPVPTTLITGAGAGTDGDRGTTPAATVEDARKYLPSSR